MKWYHLTTVQWVILIVFIAIANVFTITQRYVVPEMIRPLAYVIVVIVLFLVFFSSSARMNRCSSGRPSR